MSVFAWLIGLILPACATGGAQGLPRPPLMDMAHIERPASPNTALAAPAGAMPAPDIVTPVYPLPAERLYSSVHAVAAAQRRTFLAADYPNALQVHYVARSKVFNFPDLITVQVSAAGPDASTLVLYSRSLYGHWDLGVNRQRVATWLATLDRILKPMKDNP